MNQSAPTCPRCAAPLPPDSPHGLCAACLLSAASALDADGPDTPPPPAGPDLVLLRRAFPHLEILAPLGAGGMGRVYRVRQPHLDRVAALKILPQELARDPAWVERFQREARALARLNHPHIVQVYDVAQASTGPGDPPLCWLLMEYVDGVTLRQVQRTGGLTACEALAIVPRLCDAIHYAHEKGVLHRDIKPENILLDSTGCVKVADFGLAKLGGTGTAPSLTLTGARLGTAAYMAPEQIETPGDVDHRADIYSLGVVFYELLTGGLPLGRFPAPSEKSGTDPRLDQIVFRTLEKERDRRYQAAGEMKTAIEGVAATTPPPIPQPPPGTPLKREPRKFGKRMETLAARDLTGAPVPPGRSYMLGRGCGWVLVRLSALAGGLLLSFLPLAAWCGLCEHPDLLLDWPSGWIWLTLLSGLLMAFCVRVLWRQRPSAHRHWKAATGLGIAGVLLWIAAASVASNTGPRWPSVGKMACLTLTVNEPPLGTDESAWLRMIQDVIRARTGDIANRLQVTAERHETGPRIFTVTAAGHSPGAVRRLLEDIGLDVREKAAGSHSMRLKSLGIHTTRAVHGIDWEDLYLILVALLLGGALLTTGAGIAANSRWLVPGLALIPGLILSLTPQRPRLYPKPLVDLLPAELGGSHEEFRKWARENPGPEAEIPTLSGPENTAHKLADVEIIARHLRETSSPDEATVWKYLEAWLRRDHTTRESLVTRNFQNQFSGQLGSLRVLKFQRIPEPPGESASPSASSAPSVESDTNQTGTRLRESTFRVTAMVWWLSMRPESYYETQRNPYSRPIDLVLTVRESDRGWLISRIVSEPETE